jgi:hypothetical protein
LSDTHSHSLPSYFGRDDANFLSCIPASNIFIEAGAEAGGVLVHCFGGRSRSAALIAAFLMSTTLLDLDAVMGIIKRVRPVVSINRYATLHLTPFYYTVPLLMCCRGFEAQLRAYHQSGHDVYIAQQILLRGRIRAHHCLYLATQPRSDSSSSPPSLPMRKRSKDFTNDEMLQKMEEDQRETDTDNANDERYSRSRKAKPSLTPVTLTAQTAVTLTSLRATAPLLNVKTPSCRLTRPGSASVRVIPPLRGVGREFCCSWCGRMLFNLANVLRLDVDMALTAASVARADSKDSEGSSPVSDPGRAQPALTSRHADRGQKGFDFKEPTITTVVPVSALRSIDEYKSESKDDNDGEGKDGVGLDDELEVPAAHLRRVSGRFSVRGPVDDDDTWSVVSEPIDSSPPTRRGSAQSKASVLGVPPLRQLSRCSSPGGPGLLNAYSIDAEDSPRIPIPPYRVNEHFAGNTNLYRPQSAEKSRWLARVSLLREGVQARGTESGRLARLAQEDDEAVRLGWGADKYVHLEYLEWMGAEALTGVRPRGPLSCSGCQNVLGAYDWNPSQRHTFGGRIEAPVFRLLKSVIHEAAITLDATPMSTPRAAADDDDLVPMEN